MNDQIKNLVDLAIECNLACYDINAKNGNTGKLNLIASRTLHEHFKESIEFIVHDDTNLISKYLEEKAGFLYCEKQNVLLFVSKTKCIVGLY